MKTLALLLIHVLTTLAERAGPGGAKAIIAESVPLKHQQLIARRSAGKTPKLTRRVQEMERPLSSRFTIVEIEHTAKPFAAMNRIIG